MKIECVKEKLKSALVKCDRVVGKSLTHPILSCVLLKTEKNDLKISTTNLDLGLEITIPIKIFKEGVCAVPSSVLYGFINNLPQEDKNISLEVIDNNLTISTNSNTTTINLQDHNDFPILPRISTEDAVSNSLSSKEFLVGLKSVWFSASQSNVKPELGSVCLSSDGDSLFFVSTDSFRLSEKIVKTKKQTEFKNVLIPIKNVVEIVKILEDNDVLLEIKSNNNQITIITEGVYITSRVIDGNFPDYKQIIPKEPTTEVIVLKEDLIQHLKLANLFSDTFNQINVTIDSKTRKVLLKTKNQNIGNHTGSIDAVIKGEDISINFNFKYLNEGFQSILSDSVNLFFSGLNKPLIIKGVSDKSFTYLVMPMNK